MKVTLKSKKETKPIYLSQSAISRFLECRRKAKLAMEWVPKKVHAHYDMDRSITL